jgi:hypothetical protein
VGGQQRRVPARLAVLLAACGERAILNCTLLTWLSREQLVHILGNI